MSIIKNREGFIMPILEISVIPVGTQNTSISDYVSEACRIAVEQGLSYQVTPTATILEGDLDRILDVAKEMHKIPFSVGANRVVTNITIDDRHDKDMDLQDQVRTVVREIGSAVIPS
jgi:uncharacterized protein (TIGR00106 family)